MDISQVQAGATNAVAEWTKKQCLPCIPTTNRLCYELLNRSVNSQVAQARYMSSSLYVDLCIVT